MLSCGVFAAQVHDSRTSIMCFLPVRVLMIATVVVASFAPPALAASNNGPVAPVFGSYFDDFVEHWLGKLKQQNAVVLIALGVGAVGLFIITRGKWIK